MTEIALVSTNIIIAILLIIEGNKRWREQRYGMWLLNYTCALWCIFIVIKMMEELS
jgi:hypothetical protein